MTMTQQQCPSDQSNGDEASAEAAHPQAQLSFSAWLTPGTFLLFTSIPFGLGGYIGYRRALHSSSPPSSSSSSSPLKSALKGGFLGGKGNSILGQIILHPETPLSSSQSNIASKELSRFVSSTPPPVIAARALAIGSLLSLSATSLLVSGIFFASGCDSVDDLMSTWKSWAPKRMQRVEDSLEKAVGISAGRERRAAIKEYEQATRGMTEEEELDYVKDKCGGEIQWDADDEGDDMTNK
mmetsp:Transcript_33113/g.70573  ORF Transcript_33113/g.70573 Transcript_33113/m.70573 type:complete len:239 (+) Transcript_33113:137-853(+)|eukprot:CAMPEP_0172541676 /NCGR_PEP_ID=MMETSP1067-20121228/12445_1 /TAXON_ID=265564 ORGANISM="Thalassiosira punctigera, Strain Tpunct2005C2" /NCGR_SAMPLE_ID=MMETSP1067 /ASSEMBLY_ACC=CAM_ASM_000444 /LENGTH=238 /DNA_ID=CAMNT_0013327759 /DNA_START=71 /DNA_END=787 /DNA_ORIENTATION=+